MVLYFQFPLCIFLLRHSKIELENSIAEKAFISLRARCEELFRYAVN